MKIGYLMQAGVPDVRARRPSGAANHVIQICNEMVSRGHQVRLIAVLDGRIWKSDDLKTYTPVGIPALDGGPFRLFERAVRRIQSELQLPYMGFFDNLRFAAACRRELQGCDLLYERMGWMGGGGSAVARRLGIPHVLEINGDHQSEFEMLGVAPKGLQKWFSTRLMSRVVRRATHAVATGEGWRRRHLERWNVAPARVSVIQNGSEAVDLLSRNDLRCHHNPFDANRPLQLVYVGSFDPWQNLPLLLRAAARSVACGVDLRVTLAGSGKLRESLEKLTRDLEMEGRVTFLGHLSMNELIGTLKQADVGVSLYHGREEFTGLKILDYKSAGLATVATGANSQPVMIRHGATGVIIPPGDEEALVQAITELYRNPERVSEMGRQARLEAEQQHSWKHTTDELERLFLTLLAGRCEQPSAVSWQTGSAGVNR